MLGYNNIHTEQLEAENRRLRDELAAQTQRANVLRRLLCQAWREHGARTTAEENAASAVTAGGALSRFCVN